MSRSRMLVMFLIFTIWFSTTGFQRPPENLSSFPYDEAPSVVAPSVLAAPSFGKSLPINGATGVSATSLQLSWSSVIGYTGTGTITYRYCLQTKSKCPPSKWISVGTNTSVTVQNLTPNKGYYWWVRAYIRNTVLVNADGGTAWSFTTMRAPAAFNKSAPSNLSTGLSTSLLLSWGTSNLADYYDYCLDTVNNGACDTGWVKVSSGTSATVSGLYNNATYYWQVRAVNGGGIVLANGGTWWQFSTAVLPGVFNKFYPPINATGQLANNLILSWGVSSNAVSYEYCYSKTINDGTCDGKGWQNVLSATSATISTLNYSTDYFWQVRTVNAIGNTYADNGAWWKFTTQGPPPAGFSKLTPINGLQNQYTDITLTWQTSSFADSFEYCVVLVNDGTCDDPWTPITGTSVSLGGLDLDTVYYWQIRAINATSTVDANTGTWWSFRTHTSPPAAFTKHDPVPNATYIAINPTLRWDPSATAGVVIYQVCYDTSDDAACENDSWSTAQTATTLNLTGLANHTIYYWQVRAVTVNGTTYADGDMAAWWNFTTMLPAPTAFNKVSPQNGSPSQPRDPTLEWLASDPGVTYEYCVSLSDGTCGSEQDWETATGTSAVPTGLSYDTIYFWQVRAKNSENTVTEANTGTWWSFTTYSQPPTDFVKTSPANNANNQPINLTLSWSTAGAGFTYEYCITQNTPFSCSGAWPSVATTSVQLTGLANSTTYYWQVRAKDSSGHTTDANIQDTNPIWQFSTRNAPPASSDVTYNNINEDQSLAGDLPGANQMTFALTGTQPAGDLSLSPAGHFTYQPPLNFYGQVQFQFTVTDGINDPAGPYTVTINYVSVNDPPVLDPIADITIQSGEIAAFTPTATDPDLPPGVQLTFAIDPLPVGASFNPASGVFQWLVTWSPGLPNSYSLTLTVSDGVPTGNPVQRTVIIKVLPRRIYLPVIQH